jgi:hypothetical protein
MKSGNNDLFFCDDSCPAFTVFRSDFNLGHILSLRALIFD